MASYDSSFNADAPTVVAFECVTFGPRAFGAGVNGSLCGVHGEGMANPQGSRSVDIQGTGVHGRGDFHGVYGSDGSIAASQEPNLGIDLPGSPPVPAPIGVVGVTQGHSPAILGDNDILQKDISKMPKDASGSTNLDYARSLTVGVAGLSKNSHGMLGLAFTGDLNTPLNIPLFLGGTIPSEPGSNTVSGVAGLSVKGPGVLGVSNGDRGGVFISGTSSYVSPTGGPSQEGPPVAQVRLFPHPMAATPVATTTTTPLPSVIPSLVEAPANLPADGRQGDLLVTFAETTGNATLWLCVSDKLSGPTCNWAQVLLGPVVPVA
jgi:hypothetical protein